MVAETGSADVFRITMDWIEISTKILDFLHWRRQDFVPEGAETKRK